MSNLTLLQVVLASLCGVTLIALGVHLARNTPPGRVATGLVGLVGLGLLAHLVAGMARLFRFPTEGLSVISWIGYLVALPVVLGVAWLWSRGDKGRGGTAVLLAAMFVIPFLFVRVHDIWAFRG